LGLRARAVDFVREHDICENWPRLEGKPTRGHAISHLRNGGSEDIAWQEIAGELNSAEAAVDAAGQRLRERRLANAGHVFQQQVTTREQGFDCPADDLGLAPKRSFDVVADRRDQRRGLRGVYMGDRVVIGLRQRGFVRHRWLIGSSSRIPEGNAHHPWLSQVNPPDSRCGGEPSGLASRLSSVGDQRLEGVFRALYALETSDQRCQVAVDPRIEGRVVVELGRIGSRQRQAGIVHAQHVGKLVRVARHEWQIANALSRALLEIPTDFVPARSAVLRCVQRGHFVPEAKECGVHSPRVFDFKSPPVAALGLEAVFKEEHTAFFADEARNALVEVRVAFDVYGRVYELVEDDFYELARVLAQHGFGDGIVHPSERRVRAYAELADIQAVGPKCLGFTIGEFAIEESLVGKLAEQQKVEAGGGHRARTRRHDRGDDPIARPRYETRILFLNIEAEFDGEFADLQHEDQAFADLE